MIQISLAITCDSLDRILSAIQFTEKLLLEYLYEERNEFPPERHEIYEEATRALLSKWDASRNISRDTLYQQLSLGRKQKMLAAIAAQTFEKGEYFLHERDVVRQIEEYLVGVPGLDAPDAELVLKAMEVQHGIFVERARRIHSFSHLTLQEYYTARYIVDNERRGSVEQLMQFVGEDRWREVFLLTAGMLDDATEFFEQYLHTAGELLARDKQLTKLLNWAVQKSACLALVYQAASARAFLIFVALDRAFTLNLELALELAFELDRELARDHVLTLDLERACDLNHALVLDHDRDRDFARDFARALARDFARALTRALAHARICELHLDKMAVTLESLQMPAENAEKKVWQAFSEKLQSVLETYRDQWDIYRKFPVEDEEVAAWAALSDKQVALLTRYLEANILLVMCLQVAYVPNRQAIEDRILLPPSSS